MSGLCRNRYRTSLQSPRSRGRAALFAASLRGRVHYRACAARRKGVPLAAPRILVAAHDAPAAALLCGRLGREGFVADAASTPAALCQRLEARSYSLVVLDLALPGVDALARRLHGDATTRLITLSPTPDALERVLSLELGADDALGTPLHPQELVARIRAVLRRAGGPLPRPAWRTTRFDGWELRRHPRRLTAPSGLAVELSDAEFALLAAFLESPGPPIDRRALRAAVGDPVDRSGRAVDLLVSRLRRKLRNGGAEPAMIRSVRGAGYAFQVASLKD